MLTFSSGARCFGTVTDELGKQVLKDVSRSFYLSLRLLPAPMREGASLGYLLARTSDTVADTAAAPVDIRLKFLEEFAAAVTGENDRPRWPLHLLNAITDRRERRLLECTGEILGWLHRLPETQIILVREVLAIIISGQSLDLERFGKAGRESVVILEDGAALEDYAWRVAGCVGAFWTKLGFLTLEDRFSDTPQSILLEKGISYGKGLQLVNILRDVGEDLAHGRCYLPVADLRNVPDLEETHAIWLERARGWVGEGELYSGCLASRRLRTASVLPALIAGETLDALTNKPWEILCKRIKVPRSTVYRCMISAFFKVPTSL